MEQVRTFLDVILIALVDSPESLIVTEKTVGDSVIFTVKTKPGEEGQLIGTKGCISASIRLLLKSSAKRFKIQKKIILNILTTNTEEF